MSYTYRIGISVSESAIGKQWTFGRFTRKVWEELSREARRLMPDPLQVAMDALAAATLKDAVIIRDLNNVGSSRVDLQACKLEYSIVSPK